MILGIGTDITEVSRFEKWVKNPEMIDRFFNPNEKNNAKSLNSSCEHYAARFAAKEAFGKALGTGLAGFELKDVYIKNDSLGKPELTVENSAAELLKKRCGNANILVSLSHEKKYAVAFVVIETAST